MGKKTLLLLALIFSIIIGFFVQKNIILQNAEAATSNTFIINSNNSKVKCFLSEKIGTNTTNDYTYRKYEYNNGMKIEYSTPYKGSIDEFFAKNNPINQFFGNVQESWKKFYDAQGELIMSKICHKNDWSDCRNFTINFKSCYDNAGNKIELYSDNNKVYRKYVFDKKGNKTEEYESCNLNLQNCKHIQKYTYNSNNNTLIHCRSDIYDKYNNYKTNCHKYIYDNKNRKTDEYTFCDEKLANCKNHFYWIYNNNLLIKSYANFTREKYEYDSSGKKIRKHINCDDNFNCKNYVKYSYDNMGRILREDYGCDSNNLCLSYTKYEYQNKKTAEYTCKTATNKCSDTYIYEYDNRNNLIKKYQKHTGPSGTNESYNKYEYDNFNNLISEYDCNTNNKCILKKKYTYICN